MMTHIALNNWTTAEYIDTFPKVTERDIISYEGCGHSVHGEKKEECIKEISALFDRQEQQLS